jgi:hypothetical protein
VCREFGLINSTIKMIWKNEPKLLVRLNRTDGQQTEFESLNEVTLMRRCVGDFSKREVTMYSTSGRTALLMTTFVLPKL